MICLICRQAEIIAGLTSVEFKRSEMRLLFTNVPARVCPGCGEAFVDEEVTLRLLTEAQAISQAGIFDVECEYPLSKD